MKLTIDELNKTYNSCLNDGKIKEKVKDLELIKSLKQVAERGLDFINRFSKDIPQDSLDWTFVFREYYEALRGLIESYLLFDGIVAENHQCKNAYICFKHPELELDWEFFETIRLKRNAINYQGQLLKYDDWEKFKVKFELYINVFKKEIDNKINEE